MTAERQPRTKLFRFAISFLVIGHLLAVLLPPLSFQTRGPLGLSPSVATLLRPVEGYGQFLYIDRGYAFFAPDPGPSHLIQAAITDGSGQRVEKMFPDREEQWPRLLYHRHFMLSEFMDEIYQPPGPPEELVQFDRTEAELWVRSRARYEHVRQSVVEHLRAEYPGREVAIRRVEHLIPEVLEFQEEPISLTDERLYRVILDQPIAVESEGSLAVPVGPPESIPPPAGAAVERLTEPKESPNESAADDAAISTKSDSQGAETEEPSQSSEQDAAPSETESDDEQVQAVTGGSS